MSIPGTSFWPALLAGFLASLVEFVEALTVVLAVGVTRGWRSALAGSAAALAALAVVVVLLGPALAQAPLRLMQLAVGTLLLLFGMRWLRKALLRAAGVIAHHDENAAYAAETTALRQLGKPRGWDGVALITAFKITLLEGTEVVFIVLAVSAGGGNLWLAAGLGAVAALGVVALLGLTLHRPLARLPENALKFGVGVLLSGFGTFWVGEGLGIAWPGRDTSAAGLLVGFFLAAALSASWCRRRSAASGLERRWAARR